jgi:hypothetical protein
LCSPFEHCAFIIPDPQSLTVALQRHLVTPFLPLLTKITAFRKRFELVQRPPSLHRHFLKKVLNILVILVIMVGERSKSYRSSISYICGLKWTTSLADQFVLWFRSGERSRF